ncbi:MAG: hypothetical protein JO235_20395 [Chroococcidiopsidaceae cyanobacterium CP_BM_RX_35]|nr:hypothetical protein [Chroococcidiopsidaceae cyanobacterium CP_BM_RX_35]
MNDSLLLNLFAGGNSSPANPKGINGSPLAASQMAATNMLRKGQVVSIDKGDVRFPDRIRV